MQEGNMGGERVGGRGDGVIVYIVSYRVVTVCQKLQIHTSPHLLQRCNQCGRRGRVHKVKAEKIVDAHGLEGEHLQSGRGWGGSIYMCVREGEHLQGEGGSPTYPPLL